MPRTAKQITCTPEERQELERFAKSRTTQARYAQRAGIILMCLEGIAVKEIAQKFSIRPNTVIERRERFVEERLKAIFDKPRSGKPPQYGDRFRDAVLEKIKEPALRGYGRWDGTLLAREMNCSGDAVWRVLRKEGISLVRKRSWCVSTDPQFAAKAADVVGLYLAPPENAMVLSIDEKPGIQALERSTGYVKTSQGKIVRAYQSTYKRKGTLNLFAALETATGIIHGKVTKTKKRPDFLSFMDDLLDHLPREDEYHVILDNYCTHKKCDHWLQEHPNVHFHYTPTSASWLNLVEIWFCIFSRKALDGVSFTDTAELRRAIENYIEAYNKYDAHPFIWKKRKVNGTQISDTIVNLYN